MDSESLRERLTKIETIQDHQSRQLDKVIDLLSRMVRVEERQGDNARAVNNLMTLHEKDANECKHYIELMNGRVSVVERELRVWGVYRRIILGIFVAAAGLFSISLNIM